MIISLPPYTKSPALFSAFLLPTTVVVASRCPSGYHLCHHTSTGFHSVIDQTPGCRDCPSSSSKIGAASRRSLPILLRHLKIPFNLCKFTHIYLIWIFNWSLVLLIRMRRGLSRMKLHCFDRTFIRSSHSLNAVQLPAPMFVFLFFFKYVSILSEFDPPNILYQFLGGFISGRHICGM